jgi:hypothetical protein
MTSITKSFLREFFDDEDDYVRDLFYQTVEDRNEIGKDSLRIILHELHIMQDLIKRRMVNPISFTKPILMHGNRGIIYSNKVNIIRGEAGAHKRQLVETICSVLLSKQGIENSLGFNKNQLDHFQLIYVSTERNIQDQLPFDLQQIVTKVGYTEETLPSNFSFIPLIEISREMRFEVLRTIIRCKHAQPNYHLCIVLDVSSDFIENSNDPEHAIKLISLMKNAVSNSNCTFLCTIRENPRFGPAIGYFESELMNISSTIMQLVYDKRTGLIEVKFLKPCKTDTPASFFCKYREAEKDLTLAEGNEEQKSVSDYMAPEDDMPF